MLLDVLVLKVGKVVIATCIKTSFNLRYNIPYKYFESGYIKV